MKNQILVYRSEKKYHINQMQALKLKSKLKYLMKIDENIIDNNGYTIRTLYFDSYEDNDYFDKVDGINLRKKIRLRVYSTNQETAKLELKQKEGDLQRKQSLTISKDVALHMINGNYAPLLEMKNEFAEKIYYMLQSGYYRPKCLLSYQRFAFVENINKIRITFDTDIKYTDCDFRLFEDCIIMTPYIHDPILEVKYDGYLFDYIRKLLENLDSQQCSISKYIIARSLKK